MQLVVPSAVRNAVSAATITFTASSMILCFFIISSFLSSHRNSQILTDFLFIKNLRIREFFCNDKNYCFAMNLRIVSSRRFFVTQIPQISQIFFFIKNLRIREFLSLSHSSLATITIL